MLFFAISNLKSEHPKINKALKTNKSQRVLISRKTVYSGISKML